MAERNYRNFRIKVFVEKREETEERDREKELKGRKRQADSQVKRDREKK